MLEQIIIPVATAATGFLVGNWKTLIRWKRDNDNELVSAVKNAREDILRLYKIIDEMEAMNATLKVENINLKIEKDRFKQLADEAKGELDRLRNYISELESRLPEKKRNENRKN